MLWAKAKNDRGWGEERDFLEFPFRNTPTSLTLTPYILKNYTRLILLPHNIMETMSVSSFPTHQFGYASEDRRITCEVIL